MAELVEAVIQIPIAQVLYKIEVEQMFILQQHGVENSEYRMRRWQTRVSWFSSVTSTEHVFVDACAKEQTLRDLERLTAAGTTTSTGIRGSYNQQQSSYVVSCSGDMRTYALDEDDLRVPSFLRNRTNIPIRRMQIPGMRQEIGRASCRERV